MFSNHIHVAQSNIEELQKHLSEGGTLDQDDIDNLNALIQQVARLKNKMVQYCLKVGVPGKVIAKQFGISESRVSQIKKTVI